MKQHITLDQLNELSEKGKEKLRSYLFPSEYWGDIKERDLDIPNIMSIGRMIEFLASDSSGKMWYPKMYSEGTIDSEDLCDALWEACKEILESN